MFYLRQVFTIGCLFWGILLIAHGVNSDNAWLTIAGGAVIGLWRVMERWE